MLFQYSVHLLARVKKVVTVMNANSCIHHSHRKKRLDTTIDVDNVPVWIQHL